MEYLVKFHPLKNPVVKRQAEGSHHTDGKTGFQSKYWMLELRPKSFGS